MNDIMSRVNFYSSSMRSMFQKSFWVRTSELLFRNSERVDALLLRNKDAFILLGRKIWFARVATISARVRKKFFNSPIFVSLFFSLLLQSYNTSLDINIDNRKKSSFRVVLALHPLQEPACDGVVVGVEFRFATPTPPPEDCCWVASTVALKFFWVPHNFIHETPKDLVYL